MFILRFFKTSFSFQTMLIEVNEPFWKYLLYFLIMIMLIAFPLNYTIVSEQGFRINFIEESFTQETPNWVLPETCEIEAGSLTCDNPGTITLIHQDITYVINATQDMIDENQKAVYLLEDRLVYTNGVGASMTGYYHQGFLDRFSFRSLNLLEGTEKSLGYIAFAEQLENSFGPYIVFFSLLVNTLTTLGINIVFILMLSLVLQLFRLGYSKFFRYLDSLKFLIYTMTIPAVLSFLISWISMAFSPVIYQFGVGIITMVVMLTYGKKVFA